MTIKMGVLYSARNAVGYLYQIPMTGANRRTMQEVIDTFFEQLRPVTETTNQWLKASGKQTMGFDEFTPDQRREFNELLALDVEVSWKPPAKQADLDAMTMSKAEEDALILAGLVEGTPVRDAKAAPKKRTRRRRTT